MKHPTPTRRQVTALVALAALASLAGCGKHADATAEAGAPATSAREPSGNWLTRRAPPPGRPEQPTAGAYVPPTPHRTPDWDLDRDDPARDYARRYALGTLRYGATLDCVQFAPSQPAGDKRSVQVTGAPGCPGAGTVRDVFLVDVAGDRLTVDDKSRRDPLAHWPDGSDPEGPPGKMREIDDMKMWQVPLARVFREQRLVPVRVQAYGRGTYPIVSIADWHGSVQVGVSPENLRSFTDALCAANGGMPLGIFSAIDRVHLLRVKCPGGGEARWDEL